MDIASIEQTPAVFQPTPEDLDLITTAVEASLSKNTKKAYARTLRSFAGFARSRGASIHAIDAVMIASYIAWRAPQEVADPKDQANTIVIPGAAPATIAQELAALRRYHAGTGKEFSTQDKRLLLDTLKGIRNRASALGYLGRGQAPVMPPETLKYIVINNGNRLRDLRDRAMLLMSFAGMFRGAELVALEIRDVADEGDKLVLQIRKSKTDQVGAGNQRVIHTTGTEFCPVVAFRTWIAAADLRSGACFRAVNKWNDVSPDPLTPDAVRYVLQRAGLHAGLGGRPYSSHSLRSGGITAAVRRETPISIIAKQSLHKDLNVLQGYVDKNILLTHNPTDGVL